MDEQTSAVAWADPLAGAGHLYSTAQVAELLHVSQKTVQRWIRSGALTVMKCGQVQRVRQADLASFCEVKNPHTPPAEAE